MPTNYTPIKIQASHLERIACVYIRQSTMQQVREHTASTEIQYGLRDRALQLGWVGERVRVYDGDLGVSGSVPGQRESFSQLVADVSLGRVGIVLCFDVTRLARNYTDWYRLLDMCGVCDTLVADVDGVYDLSLSNDRLLLGMKGAMSEAEHHLIRTRLMHGLRQRAEAGELRTQLPIGYDYDDQGKVVQTDDEHIRHAIELVFHKFEQLGTANQVFAFFRSEGLLVPTRRAGSAKIIWSPATYPAVRQFLTNPCYAGAYVYGKKRSIRSVGQGEAIVVRRKTVPRSQWRVTIWEHHPGYITQAQYEQNQQRFAKNTLRKFVAGEASTVLREGRGLLQGLLRCGHCGRRMFPQYPTKAATRYVCDAQPRPCQTVAGARIDQAVVGAFHEALAPATMQITLSALELLDGEQDAVLRQLEERLEEARFQSERARRKFDEVEPGNRKVARTLETEWNRKLEEVEEIELRIEERQRQRHAIAPLSAAERARLLEFGVDLREVWDAPTTSAREKKLMLQAAFEDVFVTVVDAGDAGRQAHITLVWQGGSKSVLDVAFPQHPRVSDDVSLVERIRKMAEGMSDVQIAQALGRLGIPTTKGLPFTAERVFYFRTRHEIPMSLSEAGVRTFTAREAAAELGVSLPTVLSWLAAGFLSGTQSGPYSAWRIWLPDSVRIQATAAAPRGWLPLKEAASALGISRRQVLEDLQHGKLEGVLAGQGRRRGLRINVAKSSVTKAQKTLW